MVLGVFIFSARFSVVFSQRFAFVGFFTGKALFGDGRDGFVQPLMGLRMAFCNMCCHSSNVFASWGNIDRAVKIARDKLLYAPSTDVFFIYDNAMSWNTL